jgi:hypothetical protein
MQKLQVDLSDYTPVLRLTTSAFLKLMKKDEKC